MAILPRYFFGQLEFALGNIADIEKAKAALPTLNAAPAKQLYANQGVLDYGNFMLRMSKSKIRPEQYIKAHLITLSSIQRGARDLISLEDACVTPASLQALRAVGIDADCFKGKFFVHDIGLLLPKITSRGVTAYSVRPEDFAARFLRIQPSGEKFIEEIIQLAGPAREVAKSKWKNFRNTPMFVKSMLTDVDIQAEIDIAGLRDARSMYAKLSPQSQRFLNVFQSLFTPFSRAPSFIEDAVTKTPLAYVYFDMVVDLIKTGKVGHLIALYKDFSGYKVLPGLGVAKVPFMVSMLGRGDIPVMDARELEVFFTAKKDAIDRNNYLKLAALPLLDKRMAESQVPLPPDLEPFRAYLTHHVVWDDFLKQDTLHTDMALAIEGSSTPVFGLR